MAEKRYYFLQIQIDLFSSRRIKKMLRLEKGHTLFTIYLKMQLLSLNTEGRLTYTGLESSFAEEVALDTDESVEDVKACIDYLLKTELAEWVDESTLFLPWALKNSRSEGTSAGRMRNKRAREKGEVQPSDTDSAQSDGAAEHCDTEPAQCDDNYIHRQIHKSETEKNRNNVPRRDFEADSIFDQLWNAYPKKAGDIREAFREYSRAVDNGADPSEIQKAVMQLAFSKSDEEKRFLPSMDKWLRNRGWMQSQTPAFTSKMEEYKRRAAETAAYLEER